MNKLILLSAILILLSACGKQSDPSLASSHQEDKSSRVKSTPVSEGELIPRSMFEKADYYLISIETVDKYIKTLHSRISSQSTGYSITLIDCANNRYQDLGYGEDNKSNIKMYDDVQWIDVVSGSSKSDLISFSCNKN